MSEPSEIRSVTVRQRLKRVCQMLADGRQPADIIDTIEAEYDIGERQIRSDIAKAWEMLAEQEPAAPRVKAQMKATLWALHKRCIDAGDKAKTAIEKAALFKAATAPLDRLCRIHGLYAPTKVTLSEQKLSDEDFAKALADLAAEHCAQLSTDEIEAMLVLRKTAEQERDLAELERLSEGDD